MRVIALALCLLACGCTDPSVTEPDFAPPPRAVVEQEPTLPEQNFQRVQELEFMIEKLNLRVLKLEGYEHPADYRGLGTNE